MRLGVPRVLLRVLTLRLGENRAGGSRLGPSRSGGNTRSRSPSIGCTDLRVSPSTRATPYVPSRRRMRSVPAAMSTWSDRLKVIARRARTTVRLSRPALVIPSTLTTRSTLTTISSSTSSRLLRTDPTGVRTSAGGVRHLQRRAVETEMLRHENPVLRGFCRTYQTLRQEGGPDSDLNCSYFGDGETRDAAD